MMNFILNLSRRSKVRLQLISDLAGISIVMFLAWWLDNRGTTDWRNLREQFFAEWIFALVVAPVVLYRLGVYRAVVRYTDRGFSLRMLLAATIVTTLVSIVHWLGTASFELRLSVIFFFLLFHFLVMPRAVIRWAVQAKKKKISPQAVIYGAGEAGRETYLAISSSNRLKVVAFVDDNPKLVGSVMHDLPVIDAEGLEKLASSGTVDLVLLAIPSLTHAARRSIIDRLSRLSVRLQTIPALEDLVNGQAAFSELRNVTIEDLLGRSPVEPVHELVNLDICGKRVLVTGAGGSIGSEICRQVLARGPERLVLLEQAEYNLFALEEQLADVTRSQHSSTRVVPVLGSVLDVKLLMRTMTENRIDTIYHSAAYKHVPLVESNPLSGIRNNVLGTWVCAQTAIRSGVGKFVLISTDKAVRPTSVMGASKRMAELGIQAISMGSETVFAIVRFGNVLGSSGSVIPKFRQQVERGGPVTVTHPDIVRYFMMIPEAAQLVIQAGAMGRDGDVFVLDMGEPIRILDLAKKMIKLSGRAACIAGEQEIEGAIPITFTGLRPGEKLYEELLISEQNQNTRHPRIQRAKEPSISKESYNSLIDRLNAALDSDNTQEALRVLHDAPLEWSPTPEVGACEAQGGAIKGAGPSISVAAAQACPVTDERLG